MDYTPQDAINAALKSDWKQAVTTNLRLIKQNPKDIDSLNRLGRAYTELGLKTKAKNIYSQVTRLDKFNSIATRNLELLKKSRVSPIRSSPPPAVLPLFLEEHGVTKTVPLIRPGDPKVISSLHPGDAVKIVARGHLVSVVSSQNAYLGRLPDDLASRLRSLINAGNKYDAWIKSVDTREHVSSPTLKIFIRETFRSHKFRHSPSFPLSEKLSYAAFTPPELVHDEKPDVSTPEEQDTESRFDADSAREES